MMLAPQLTERIQITSSLSGTTVKFGATATLMDEDTEEEKRYQIVGELEADVKKGRISITSPMARALIGKKVGDVVEVTTPGGATLRNLFLLGLTALLALIVRSPQRGATGEN